MGLHVNFKLCISKKVPNKLNKIQNGKGFLMRFIDYIGRQKFLDGQTTPVM